MGFGDSSLSLKIAFILLIIALVIQILGVALPYWYSDEVGTGNNKVTYYGGLFRSCWEMLNKKHCSSIKNPSGELFIPVVIVL